MPQGRTTDPALLADIHCGGGFGETIDFRDLSHHFLLRGTGFLLPFKFLQHRQSLFFFQQERSLLEFELAALALLAVQVHDVRLSQLGAVLDNLVGQHDFRDLRGVERRVGLHLLDQGARLGVGLAEGRGFRIFLRLNPGQEKARQRSGGNSYAKLLVNLTGNLALAHALAKQGLNQRAHSRMPFIQPVYPRARTVSVVVPMARVLALLAMLIPPAAFGVILIPPAVFHVLLIPQSRRRISEFVSPVTGGHFRFAHRPTPASSATLPSAKSTPLALARTAVSSRPARAARSFLVST